MLTTIRLPGDITLHTCRDTRFKQGCLSIQFLLPLCREEAGLNALIPAILLRGSGQYPDIQAITAGLDDLYGSGIGVLSRKYRSVYGTGFYLSFLEDRFAMDGEQVLFPLLDMAEDLLLHPVGEGCFRPDFVESEKQNLIAAIESRKNNKAAYAMQQLINHMCGADPSGTPRLGTVKTVSAITPESAWNHYRKLLLSAPISVFYVGSMEPEVLSGKIEAMFASLHRETVTLPEAAPFCRTEEMNRTEKQILAQSQLCMGFLTDITLEHPLYPAAQLLNILYGSGMTSKLFLQVREKQSLCYSIQSVYTAGTGIITVDAGIDAANREKTQQEILHQLEKCCRGEITDEEITAARQSFRAGLESIMDSPSALEGYYTSAIQNGLDLDPRARIDRMDTVTREEIMAAARSIRLHSTFYLEGEHA